MPIPVRSIRLQKRTSQSLDTISGASGEIFFDADRGTLRLYTANAAENIILADRAWVTANTFDGNYANLTNVPPSAVTDVSQLTDTNSLFFDRDYNSLDNLPNLDDLVTDISTIGVIGDVNISGTPESGQLLVWDGSIWVNQTVSGFADTNTTYDVTASATAAGAEIILTDDQAVTTTVELVSGAGIGLAITDTNEITISSSIALSLNDLSNTSITNVQDAQTLVYSSGQWINTSASSGVGLDDFSVTVEGESGGGNLTYSSGAFTYTPPDLNSFATLSGFSVTTDSSQSGGSLSYDDSNGTFTFRPANLSGYSQLTDLSVTTDGTPAGGGSLTYNNSSGEFTFVPADVGSGGGGNVVDDTNPQLGGDLDLNNYNITGTGNINTTGNATFSGGTVSADTFTSSGSGAPVLTSASTITLTAPDGVIIESVSRISELMSNDGTAVSGTRTFDTSISPIEYITGATANITVNFTNVPTTNDVSHSFSVVIDQSATAFIINAIQIAGAVQTILWADGSAPSGTNSGTDVFTFTLLRRSSAWTVLGSATSYS
jgi:hypothetical protein